MNEIAPPVIKVTLGERSYDIVVGDEAQSKLAARLAATTPGHVALIADERVHHLHGQELACSLPSSVRVFTVAAGESSKSLETAARIYDWLAAERIGRQDLIVAFGGGMVGDLAGFVAGTWMRGIPYVQVPTTLLAAIDASVGGKTAVNLGAAKNLVGVFHQPIGVFIHLGFLNTLPRRERVAALAESVKHAAIRRPDLLEWHHSCAHEIAGGDPDVLGKLVADNCTIKADIVARDEREQGLRAILNYGHTIGHALEHLLDYELRHGECIGLGMLVENEIARARGMFSNGDAYWFAGLLAALGLPVQLRRAVDSQGVSALCQLDKKAHAGSVHMVVLEGFGNPVRITDVTADEIARALRVITP